MNLLQILATHLTLAVLLGAAAAHRHHLLQLPSPLHLLTVVCCWLLAVLREAPMVHRSTCYSCCAS